MKIADGKLKKRFSYELKMISLRRWKEKESTHHSARISSVIKTYVTQIIIFFSLAVQSLLIGLFRRAFSLFRIEFINYAKYILCTRRKKTRIYRTFAIFFTFSLCFVLMLLVLASTTEEFENNFSCMFPSRYHNLIPSLSTALLSSTTYNFFLRLKIQNIPCACFRQMISLVFWT